MINYINKGDGLLKLLNNYGVYIYWLDGEIQCSKPDSLSYEEVNSIIDGYNPWAYEKSMKLAEINAWLENQIQLILNAIPKSEQISWSIQVDEATGVKPLRMLLGIAQRRGISVETLIAKVLAKSEAFSDYYSLMQGERDRVEDLVKAFPDEGQYELLPDLWALSCTV